MTLTLSSWTLFVVVSLCRSYMYVRRCLLAWHSRSNRRLGCFRRTNQWLLTCPLLCLLACSACVKLNAPPFFSLSDYFVNILNITFSCPLPVPTEKNIKKKKILSTTYQLTFHTAGFCLMICFIHVIFLFSFVSISFSWSFLRALRCFNRAQARDRAKILIHLSFAPV